MQKSEIKPEDWILTALMNASERYGFDLDNWYQFKRPDRFNIDRENFLRIKDKMEDEGFLKRASSDAVNYCLSDKGKKEAIRLKRRLNFADYSLIISNFPEIELRERIEILEFFVITSFGLFLIAELNKLPFSSYISDFSLLIALLSVLLFISLLVSYYFAFNFIKILIFWIIRLQRDTLWVYKEWLWNNQNKIVYPIPALVIFIILYVLYIMNIAQWQSIVWGLVLLMISQLLLNYKKIVKELQLILEKNLK